MQDLPKNISEKLNRLPVMPFDGSDDFIGIILSEDFTDIFTYYKEHYLPESMNSQSEIQQKTSLYLTLTNQDEDVLTQTNNVLYKRPVPDIHTFLTDKYFMGMNNISLYKYWQERLEEMFKTGSPVRKAIFSGCIGAGKSTVARKAFLYVLYRMLCLRYPRAILGVDADAKLAAIMISMTLDQAFQTNLGPLMELMKTMPCFQQVRSVRSFENFDLSNPRCPIPWQFEKSSMTIYFPDSIVVKCGSSQAHFTGFNCFDTFVDEINEKGMEESIKLLNTLDNRLSSRFQGSNLIFQSIVSSARTTNSPLGEYVKHLPKNDPSIVKYNPMLWEIKPDSVFAGDGTTFPVQVGNGAIPSKIITDPGELKAIEDGNYVEPNGCLLIQVPTVYRTRFELQLDQSIQDLAGIATQDDSLVFRDTTKLEDPMLCPELQVNADLGENNDLFQWLIDNTELFEKSIVDGKYYLKRASRASRYCHIDLSSAGGKCDTGLSLMHKEYVWDENTKSKQPVYIVDFIMAVQAKNKIDIEAIERFYIDLVRKGNVPIHTISTDQYQSELVRNNWEKSGCFIKVEKVSVDSKLEPYQNCSREIELGHVKVGVCPKFKRELETLAYVKGKVERTTELKDMADSITGSLYNAQINYHDIPFYEYNPAETKPIQDYNDYSIILKKNEILEEI